MIIEHGNMKSWKNQHEAFSQPNFVSILFLVSEVNTLVSTI